MKLSPKEKTRIKNRYGPWAVFTGASSGIGKELATRLAEAHLNVVLSGRNESELDGLASTLHELYEVKLLVIASDLSERQGADKVIDETKQLNIGMFIAAAGFGTSGSFLEGNIDEELDMLQVNGAALLQLTHHFVKRFASRGGGGIILLSSMVGFQGVPYAANYAATKAYVQSLGEALSVELKPDNVDVLAAAPGPVGSGFAKRANLKMGKTMSPTDIGVPILKALGRRSTVLPGFQTKFLVSALRTVPRWGKVQIMKLVMGGMTKHQRA